MADRFKSTPDFAAQFARRGAVVTPNDSADLTNVSRLYVAADGSLKFTPADNTDGTFLTINVVAGQLLPWLVKRVWVATTATVIALD